MTAIDGCLSRAVLMNALAGRDDQLPPSPGPDTGVPTGHWEEGFLIPTIHDQFMGPLWLK